MAPLRQIFGGGSLDRRARTAFARLNLSEKVLRAVLRSLPPGLTDPTLRLLAAAIDLWRRGVPGDVIAPELTDGWVRDGGKARELERLRAMFRYRRARSEMDNGDRLASPGTAGRATDELRSFWLTTGHDVAELDQFMADVDAEFPGVIPG
jgi:hypothetical protein